MAAEGWDAAHLKTIRTTLYDLIVFLFCIIYYIKIYTNAEIIVLLSFRFNLKSRGNYNVDFYQNYETFFVNLYL